MRFTNKRHMCEEIKVRPDKGQPLSSECFVFPSGIKKHKD